jgi:hypothetical protein
MPLLHVIDKLGVVGHPDNAPQRSGEPAEER